MNSQLETPRHIAIIMDGNGRWAKERGLSRREGHRAGAEAVREALEVCSQLKIEYLTLYAFSSENWKRPKSEIESLMKLLESFLKEKIPQMLEHDVKLMTIGNIDRLPKKCIKQIEKATSKTKNNKGTTLVLALSYGAREEITRAARHLAKKAKSGEISADQIDNELFAKHLYTAEIPDPDLLIRTSGEMRISNFMLWQISYSEIIISKKYWPDFHVSDLHSAIKEYSKRHRRFGSL